jgi:hypothetical protein
MKYMFHCARDPYYKGIAIKQSDIVCFQRASHTHTYLLCDRFAFFLAQRCSMLIEPWYATLSSHELVIEACHLKIAVAEVCAS